MKRVSRSLAFVAGALLCFTQAAAAGTDVESELAEMREMVKGLQQKVDAQEEQLSHQGEMLEEAQQAVRDDADDQSLSALSSFIESIEVDGHISGSYFYNFNQPDGRGGFFPLAPGLGGAGGNQGVNGAFYPFHPDHNSFSVDQVWFGIGKPATEESRAGFRLDLLYGQTANFLGQGGTSLPLFVTGGPGAPFLPFGPLLVGPGGIGPGGTPVTIAANSRARGDATSQVYIHQAYVEWLAPLGDEGVNVRFGKFATLVGAEVADTTQNYNITRGAVYNLLQPLDHVGLIGSTQIGPVNLAAGIVNQGSSGFSVPDVNRAKSAIAQAGFGFDQGAVNVTLVYGSEMPTNNHDQNGLIDVVATFDPMDNLSLWVNFDYAWADGRTALLIPGLGPRVNIAAGDALGVAAAGRLGITEDLGAAIRLEYVRDTDAFLGLGTGFSNSEVYTATGTIDYALVENLLFRAELRWDRVTNKTSLGEFFVGAGANTLFPARGFRRDQVTLGGEVVYTF